MIAGKDVFPGHPSPSVMSAPFGDKEVVRTLTGMGLEAPPEWTFLYSAMSCVMVGPAT